MSTSASAYILQNGGAESLMQSTFGQIMVLAVVLVVSIVIILVIFGVIKNMIKKIILWKNEKNPAHFCDCGKYIGHRGFCSDECHNKHYDANCVNSEHLEVKTNGNE